jgi:hypothetical protein
MTLQGTFITQIMWNSRAHPAIVPVIDSGKYIISEIHCDRILRNPAVHHKPTQTKKMLAVGHYANPNLEFRTRPKVNLREPAAVHSVNISGR